MRLIIKNMVCNRCLSAVKQLLERSGYHIVSITLADVEISEQLTDQQKASLADELSRIGFELLDNPRSQLVEQIRIAVQQWARMRGERSKVSDYLTQQLGKNYSVLSKLFSEVRGITIEHYAMLHRIEYAKELLCYNQMSVSEIAYMLGFSSPAHLSKAFKDATGMSPTQFRGQSSHERRPLDEL